MKCTARHQTARWQQLRGDMGHCHRLAITTAPDDIRTAPSARVRASDFQQRASRNCQLNIETAPTITDGPKGSKQKQKVQADAHRQ
jgi:hypothetical protein